MQKITDAMDNASGAVGLGHGRFDDRDHAPEMAEPGLDYGVQQLENIDAGGELQSAFEQADSCAGLTTTT